MNTEPKHDKKSIPPMTTHTRPHWLRWLLMAILIAICAIGFYHTNAVTFERIMNR